MHACRYMTGTNTLVGQPDWQRYTGGPVAAYMSGTLHDHSIAWKVTACNSS